MCKAIRTISCVLYAIQQALTHTETYLFFGQKQPPCVCARPPYTPVVLKHTRVGIKVCPASLSNKQKITKIEKNSFFSGEQNYARKQSHATEQCYAFIPAR